MEQCEGEQNHDTHKLVCLYDIGKALEQLSADSLIKVVEYMVANDHQSTIVTAIFRQLYLEGESNSKQFLNGLKHYCENLSKISNEIMAVPGAHIKKSNGNGASRYQPFETLPDAIFMEIGKYLSTNEIFSSWQQVSRAFFQIGMKSEIISEFTLSDNLILDLQTLDRKFRFNSVFSRIKSLTLTSEFDIDFDKDDFDLSGIKSLQTFTIQIDLESPLDIMGGNTELQAAVGQICANSVLQKLYIEDFYHSIDYEWPVSYPPTILQLCKIQPATVDHNSDSESDALDCYYNFYQNIKQIHFRYVTFVVNANRINANGIENILDALIPLSPKAYELRKTLKNELPSHKKQQLTQWEIDKIEDTIKTRIDEKYNEKFDENKLNSPNSMDMMLANDNIASNKKTERMKKDYQWSSSIEMIVFSAGDSIEDYELGPEWLQFMKDQLTSDRITQCFQNLKSLGLRCVAKRGTLILTTIGVKLINTICNQLTSCKT